MGKRTHKKEKISMHCRCDIINLSHNYYNLAILFINEYIVRVSQNGMLKLDFAYQQIPVNITV